MQKMKVGVDGRRELRYVTVRRCLIEESNTLLHRKKVWGPTAFVETDTLPPLKKASKVVHVLPL